MAAEIEEEDPLGPVVANAAAAAAPIDGQLENGEVWVGDSGATHHFTNSKLGMYDFRPVTRSVKMPHGHSHIEGHGK